MNSAQLGFPRRFLNFWRSGRDRALEFSIDIHEVPNRRRLRSAVGVDGGQGRGEGGLQEIPVAVGHLVEDGRQGWLLAARSQRWSDWSFRF
jgi:hypothetical protein